MVEVLCHFDWMLCAIIYHMSGHSHWSTIKRAKAATDAKKSKIFSKLSRLITVAAREGGGDPDTNPSLRLAIEKAKSESMPKDNIQRAIEKGLGKSASGASFSNVIYEGYGPEGSAFLVNVLTDNKNRTVAEIRNLFGKYGGSLGTSGSTAYIFAQDPKNPTFTVSLSPEGLKKAQELQEALEAQDDVSGVYSNVSF